MAIIASEDFTGASTANLHGRTTTTGGRTWECLTSTSSLKLNGAGQLRSTTSSGAVGRVDLGVADHAAGARLLAFGSNPCAAVAVRVVNLSNFIGLRALDAASVELFKRVGSTSDQRVALIGGLALSLPVELELRIEGTTARVFVGGAPVGATGGYTIADAVFAGVTHAGLFARGSPLDPALDDWSGSDLGVALLAPAGGRCATRGQAGALAGHSPSLAGTGGRIPLRGAAGALAFSPAAGALAGAGGRVPLRAAAAGLLFRPAAGPADPAIILPVAAEARVRPVERD
ncbi:MAG: hypothetical protein ACK40H_04890 [Sphingomonadaceae bacterium]